VQLKQHDIGLVVGDSLMRVYVAEPAIAGTYPGILFYSDIYQLGRSITLLADRLAGYGYVVAAPEIFHRLEAIGTAIEPGALGRLQGNDAARRTRTQEFDADATAVLDWLATYESVRSEQLGAIGFCIGGHLAFRAALQPRVRATVCCYPTGIHSGKLGGDRADSLERAAEIRGQLLLIYGDRDPHVPPDGRQKIMRRLHEIGLVYHVRTYDANHTFMRDDGDRYDPVATDMAWSEIVAFFERVFDARESLPHP